MTWDWKKATHAKNRSSIECSVNSVSAGKVPSATGTQKRPGSSGSKGLEGMVWRPAGVTGGPSPGASFDALVYEDEFECVFCAGRGELANGGLCPVCNGGKKVHVPGPVVRCAFCKGQGQMPPRSNMTCWVCKGRGVVHVTPPVELCPECRGRGRRPCETLYCSRCKGVGVIASAGFPIDRRGVRTFDRLDWTEPQSLQQNCE